MPRPSFIQAALVAVAFCSVAGDVPAQSAQEFITRGDRADATFHASEALENYLPAEKLQPGNASLLVRIARQYRYLMSDAASPDEKLKLGGMALAYGKLAAERGPGDSDAQLSQAITYGKMLPFQGKRAQVDAVPLIKNSVDKALLLDPGNDTAWHVLGRWHLTLANVTGLKRALGGVLYGELPHSTHADAIACFKQAIALNPRRPRHFIEMGRAYAQMGQPQPAREFIEKGLAMPDVERDDPEIKRLGREVLAKLP